jgi:hypothetical protein
MSGYRQEIEMPKNMKEGLCNFVKMMINAADEGDCREVCLKGIDLLNDLRFGVYDSAMGISRDDAKSNLNTHMEKLKKDSKDFAASEYARGLIDGASHKQKEIVSALGL